MSMFVIRLWFYRHSGFTQELLTTGDNNGEQKYVCLACLIQDSGFTGEVFTWEESDERQRCVCFC